MNLGRDGGQAGRSSRAPALWPWGAQVIFLPELLQLRLRPPRALLSKAAAEQVYQHRPSPRGRSPTAQLHAPSSPAPPQPTPAHLPIRAEPRLTHKYVHVPLEPLAATTAVTVFKDKIPQASFSSAFADLFLLLSTQKRCDDAPPTCAAV